MKLIADYLENAEKFARLAAEEPNTDAKAKLEKQAMAYRRLAEKRANALNVDLRRGEAFSARRVP